MKDGNQYIRIVGRLIAPLFLYEVVTELSILSAYQVVGIEFVPLLAIVTWSAAITWFLLLFFWEECRFLIRRKYKDKGGLFLLGYYLLPAVAGGGMCLSLNAVISLAPFSKEALSSDFFIYQLPIAIQILGTGLIIPATEEMIFRGIVFFNLRSVLSVRKAALLSALYFGVFHGNVVQGIYAFVLGIFLAWLADESEGVLQPWAFHVGANVTSIGMMAVKEQCPALERGNWSMLLPCIGVVAAVVAFIGISRMKNEEKYYIEREI